ncbi:MAG: hypothetical protein JSU70_10770 [Phycisphaerales bacterium]|nr:MAG: hypothetical protein JSU70_10770 [Phycisphaerales bacterium]
MRGWRSKFVFLLIVYFSGFATAIYFLGPAPKHKSGRTSAKSVSLSALKSDEFAQSLNTGMHKCVDFSKDAALRAAMFIKQKLEEGQEQSRS